MQLQMSENEAKTMMLCQNVQCALLKTLLNMLECAWQMIMNVKW